MTKSTVFPIVLTGSPCPSTVFSVFPTKPEERDNLNQTKYRGSTYSNTPEGSSNVSRSLSADVHGFLTSAEGHPLSLWLLVGSSQSQGAIGGQNNFS